MAVTLHRLLWGVAKAGHVGSWTIRAHEVPAIGLPVRVSAALFLAARKQQCADGWRPKDGPLVWRIANSRKLLSVGRQLQLGYRSEPGKAGSPRSPCVHRSTCWEVPPHPAYFVPLVGGVKIHSECYVLYCDALLFLTALDGGERILDSLYRSGLSGVPLEDRWAWRSRIHLREETWKELDKVIRWANTPNKEVSDQSLIDSFDESWRSIDYDDFGAERVDLLLEEGKYLEVIRTVGTMDAPPELPPDLRLTDTGLSDNLFVRIAQLSKWYPESEVANRFPPVAPAEANDTMRQVAASFAGSASDSEPDLVLLPEASIPGNEVQTLRKFVEKTGIAALYGLYWRELPAVYPGQSVAKNRWIVNEAEVVIPLGHDTAGPPTVRWFRVRKPVPAHMEEGLARRLSKRDGVKYRLLKGRRWYRFVQKQWGDFSIAICADLIDAEPWRIFRGEMLHLFTVAFNKDVELYDALTWVRAYESYVNVLAVNHGKYGGSFVWTPKGSHQKELARLRGSRLFLVADVELPVKDLFDAQRQGVKLAVKAAKKEWAGGQQKPQPFKSPPPGFRRKV